MSYFFETILQKISEQCPHPYHNRQHTEEVIERVTALASHVRSSLDDQDVKLVRLAALFHDYDHCGQTIRQTCIGANRTDISNEEFAAEEARQWLAEILQPQEISVVQSLILATSFGQADPQSAYHRPYKPSTLLEKLLAFADIAGIQKPFERWMDENFQVLQEANPATIPQTFEAWIKTRHGFLDYCRSKLAELAPHLDPDYASNLSRSIDALAAALSVHGRLFRERFEEIRK